MRRKNRNQRGAAAVEFALVLPVLVLLLVGIIEFSLALYDKAVITNASREGARAGILFRDPALTDSEMTNLVNGVVTNYCQTRMITFGSPADVTTTVEREAIASGDGLKVNVRYNYQFLVIPRFVADLKDTVQLELGAQTIMRME